MIKLDILDVLSYYGANVNHVSRFGWSPIKCIWHNDSHASASVNVDLGGFKCHTCGISGDGIKIIREQEHLGFEEAVEFARKISPTSLEDLSFAARKHPKGRGRKKRQFISY